MKRARSALSLRNLASSIQQSIQAHHTHTHLKHTTKNVLPLKVSRSSAQLLRDAGEEREKRKERVENRVFVLERQIVGVEKQIEGSTSTVRDYTKELDHYETLQGQIKQKERQYA